MFERLKGASYIGIFRPHPCVDGAFTREDLTKEETEQLMREYEGRTSALDRCQQIAGKALGYPAYKDDQKNFPGATEKDGVCIGEHVEETIVQELANAYTKDIVKYYLESHITIEPVFDAQRDKASNIARGYGFKLAHLLMQKERTATAERSDRDTFMTGHSRSKEDIIQRTKQLVAALQREGFKVWRYKIEDTLIDSRNEDVWGVI